MPGIVVVDNQGGRDWGQVPAELARRTGWEVIVATMPLPAQLDKFEGGVLVGTGVGAAEITSYAGSVEDHRIWGIALVSPRFHTEAVDLREELGYIRIPILIVKRGPTPRPTGRRRSRRTNATARWTSPAPTARRTLARILAEFAATLALTQGTGAGA